LILAYQGRTQPNKTYKCNTQELTQGHLPMTKFKVSRYNSAQGDEGLSDSRTNNRLNEIK